MKKYPTYHGAAELYKSCILYAHSYATTMVHRVLEEEPEYFEDKPLTKTEFIAHLEGNMCLGIAKYRARALKDMQAQV